MSADLKVADPATRLAEIRARIESAKAEHGRAGEHVRLIAVSKTFGADEIRPVIAAGQRDFGENRVQEAKGKWPVLRGENPDLRLHLIGPLQSNKAADAVALFDAIHSIDRDRIAQAVAAEMAKQGRTLRLLVQVNTGAEPQKAGVLPEQLPAFLDRCRGAHGLAIDGLMCIPPADEPPGPHFALLRKIAERHGLRSLSMGINGDRLRRHRHPRRQRDLWRTRLVRVSYDRTSNTVSGPSRAIICRSAGSSSATQPSVGRKPGRATWRKIALPLPRRGSGRFQSSTTTRS
jgi:pyridoxal phosphate enzyme (YggS family)